MRPQLMSTHIPSVLCGGYTTAGLDCLTLESHHIFCWLAATVRPVGHGKQQERPIVFALSNPKSQAEVTATDAYTWSNGEVIYGSGTQFPPCTINGREHAPGQVNNVYIFPGMSFGAM
jgi:hypothetical protein